MCKCYSINILMHSVIIKNSVILLIIDKCLAKITFNIIGIRR